MSETKAQFLHNISQKVLQYNIPDELVINAYQTPSKFIATNNITTKGEKHISRTGSSDKRSITLTVCKSNDGTMLPFHFIYKGKTARSLPNEDLPEGICLSHNMKHYSNETETNRLIKDLLVPYTEKPKEGKALPHNQKSLLIWDASKA